MVSKLQATRIVRSKQPETDTIRFYREYPDAYVFICSKPFPVIPDKLIAAVNKTTGKVAYHIYDVTTAIQACCR